MDKSAFLNSIKKLKEVSPKREFTQSIDLIVNLKAIDLKKPEHKVDIFITLPYSKGKPVKICGLVGNELATQSKTVLDKTITNEEFKKYNEKKTIKKLASEFDFFVAQANLMAQIATVFGKTLGPRGKMPNPKAGCVVPGTAQLMPLKEKLQKTIHLQTKNEASIKASIGVEAMNDSDLSENAFSAVNSIIHVLPQEQSNIKSVILKTTMGPPVIVTEHGPKLKTEPDEKASKSEIRK
ncbi:50S ribosomal protein L1 [Candidatus Woesearchaeota archaeon]|nr:50S ribosomal protein L1 [Candidatus Woesearchaeota archaeon]